jgi:hypothetical protein
MAFLAKPGSRFLHHRDKLIVINAPILQEDQNKFIRFKLMNKCLQN